MNKIGRRFLTWASQNPKEVIKDYADYADFYFQSAQSAQSA